MLSRIVLILVLFTSLVLGFYMWNQSDTAVHKNVSVKGVYHEGKQCDSNSACSSHPYVTFRTRQGSTSKFYPFDMALSHQQFIAAFYDESAYQNGQSVSVLYDPSDPGQALISSSTHLWGDMLLWFAVGAGLLIGVMIRGLRQDRRKPGPPGPPMRR
ncbi:MAG TPA: DUF3592 domain-containing protein [Ktedonobacteraceae bacterium]